MKSKGGFRQGTTSPKAEDTLKKAVKLAPIKKSGKTRHTLFSSLDEDDDFEFEDYKHKESVFDYFDDDEQEDGIDTEDDEDFEDEEDYEENGV